MKRFKRHDSLGIAHGKRRYDLPLSKDAGTGFLVLLICLMTFLAVMALAGAFVLGSLSGQWSSGLENKITIEIPAEKNQGEIRTQKEIYDLAERIDALLRKNKDIDSITVLSEQDVRDLVSPWLGEDAVLEDIPLPGLVSVTMKNSTPESLNTIKTALNKITPDIVLDTHEAWLKDVLSLTRALQFAALLVVVIIGITTVTAVGGAIRSRMEVYKDDVELLHLMGAHDEYITRQFNRHAFILALQGSLGGLIAAFFILASIAVIAADTGRALLPDFTIGPEHAAMMLALPVAICLIAVTTARFTVLHVLSRMP